MGLNPREEVFKNLVHAGRRKHELDVGVGELAVRDGGELLLAANVLTVGVPILIEKFVDVIRDCQFVEVGAEESHCMVEDHIEERFNLVAHLDVGLEVRQECDRHILPRPLDIDQHRSQRSKQTTHCTFRLTLSLLCGIGRLSHLPVSEQAGELD